MSRTATLLRTLVLAVTVGALAVAAGCARASGPGSPSGPAPATDHDREAQAQRDAAERLALFRAPAGATRLAGQPADAHVLGVPGDPTTSTAAATAWYRVSGDPQAVLRGIATPDGASPGDSSSSGGPDVMVYGVTFSWTPSDVLATRTMTVQATRVGTGTVLRVDATAVWRPVRSAASLVPATARPLVVSFRPDTFGGPAGATQPYGPLTVTDPAQIAAIAAEVNSLPVEPYRARPCPAPIGDLVLLFGAGVQVRATLGGCNDVEVTAGGASVTLVGARELTGFVLDTLHLAWQVPH
jgi:hypothetical protein